jgi:hypothetical protein
MNMNIKTILAAAGLAAVAFSPAYAYEGGANASQPGGFIGSSAAVPPPGIYMFNQVFTDQRNFAGPGTASLGLGTNNGVHVNDYNAGFLFVPGWTFLGATYDAVVIFPFVDVGIGNPLASVPGTANLQSGAFDTYIVPIELSWKLGTSGFYVKTGLGMYVPDGTITGANGLGNVGNPRWTFQPELILSYLKDGWNLSAALYTEFNTENTFDHYTNGDVFHADLTATKTIGKWTVGPVAYYYAQITNDTCSDITCLTAHPLGTLTNAQRYQVLAFGGLVGYDFGPVNVSVWATSDVLAKASNAAAVAALGADDSLIQAGTTVFATVGFRLWAPDAPATQPAMFHK